MDKVMDKLKDLENARRCVLKCQEVLLKEMMGEIELNADEYLKLELTYSKNRDELKDINKKIEILSDAIDIVEGIGV